jgi:CHAD domain-containing protein/CYTH domain-containing protein
MNDTCYKTVKKGAGIVREEIEKEIPKKTYKKKRKKHLGKIIRKTRYIMQEDGLHYDIDIYSGELAGLHTLEVEFPDLSTLRKYQAPEEIAPYLLEDVTEDARYKNGYLALHGIPSNDFTEVMLPVMYEMNEQELDAFRVGNLACTDALRLILYKFALLILHYEALYLQDTDPEALHQFRVNLRRSRAFLKSFRRCFHPDAFEEIYQNLSDIASSTNHARDLDVIAEELAKNPDNTDTLASIRQEQKTESEKIKTMLQSDHFRNFFNDYLAAVRSGEIIDASQVSNHPIKDHASAVLQKLHQGIIRKIEKEEKHFDQKVIHKIRIAFKKLRYLLEEFEEIFGSKKVERYIDTGKKLQTLLGNYNDAINQVRLLKEYRHSHKKKIPKVLIKKRKKHAGKLLKKVRKSLHRFKRKRFIV